MIRRAVQMFTIAYAVILIALLLALEWRAEKNWILSLMLFAPAWGFLLPLALLTPLTLISRQWKALLIQLVCVLAVLFGYTSFRWTRKPAVAPGDLKVITHNAGEGNAAQFTAFLERESPDVILLQDAASRGLRFAKLFPQHSVAVVGEYICISRFPVRSAGFVPDVIWEGRPSAARFELDVNGRTLVAYSVHMPTPRPQLYRFLTKGFVREVLEKKQWPDNVKRYQKWLDEQIARAECLAGKIAAEKEQFIIAGDLNTPEHGYIYHLFAKRWADSFAHAGRGWGMTFPGGRDGQAARSKPWLRLDYVFAGNGWSPIFCEPESGTRSQHRAVVAILRPRSPATSQ